MSDDFDFLTHSISIIFCFLEHLINSWSGTVLKDNSYVKDCDHDGSQIVLFAMDLALDEEFSMFK